MPVKKLFLSLILLSTVPTAVLYQPPDFLCLVASTLGKVHANKKGGRFVSPFPTPHVPSLDEERAGRERGKRGNPSITKCSLFPHWIPSIINW